MVIMDKTSSTSSAVIYSKTNGHSTPISSNTSVSIPYDDTDDVDVNDDQQSNQSMRKKEWSIRASPRALATINPIRRIVETMDLQPNRDKHFIPLSIGDPTLFGNFKPCDEIIESMVSTITSSKYNGYQPACGSNEARAAVANYCQSYGMAVDAKDIILTSGCSHALDLCMSILAQPNCNILVPCPGFPLYKTLSTLLGIEIRYYRLMAERCWQIDLEDLRSKIDTNTVGVIYNNPSNPCGSVFPRRHIEDFLAICERYRLPVIADEIYENLIFPGHEFHALASLTDQVPILHCSGSTKKFLIPGWRLGWVAINDRHERFGDDIRNGLNSLAARLLGPNSLAQGAIGKILTLTPKSFFDDIISQIHRNAKFAYNRLKQMNGLVPIEPAGAFYMMCRIQMEMFPSFRNDLHLVEQLVHEESVFCLPGRCFEFPGYIRLVLALDFESLREAIDRIELFVNRYYTAIDNGRINDTNNGNNEDDQLSTITNGSSN